MPLLLLIVTIITNDAIGSALLVLLIVTTATVINMNTLVTINSNYNTNDAIGRVHYWYY